MTNEKTSKSERTRQYIIEKVAPVFNTKGFVGASLSDLTNATGLTKGAIYGHFKNKDELALAAFEYNFSHIAKHFYTAFSTTQPAIKKLMQIPDIYRKTFPQILVMGGCPILNTIADTDDSGANQALRQASINALKGIKQNIEKLLHQAITEKSIHAKTDPNKTAALILTLVEGGILMAKTMQQPSYYENAVQEIERLINTITL